MRLKLLLGLLAVAGLLVAGGLGYARLAGRDGHAGRANQIASSAPALATSARVTSPLPQGPFKAIRPELERLALAGNADATYRLGTVIAHCQGYKPLPFEEMSTILAEFVARGRTVQDGERTMEDSEVVNLVVFGYRKMQETCQGAEDLQEPSPKKVAFAWIEKAAAQGHLQAMVEYQDFAFAEFASDADLLENASLIALRRERARSYLAGALRSGHADALLGYAKAYGMGAVLGQDPIKALAYWQAYARIASEESVPASLRVVVDQRFRAGLSDQQQRQAAELALRLGTGLQEVRP